MCLKKIRFFRVPEWSKQRDQNVVSSCWFKKCSLFSAGGKFMNWQKFFFYNVKGLNPEKRDAGKGQWEMVEKDEEVEFYDEQLAPLTAKKSVLVFWKSKGNSLAKTKWVMHEFRLALKSNPSKVNNTTVSIHPPPFLQHSISFSFFFSFLFGYSFIIFSLYILFFLIFLPQNEVNIYDHKKKSDFLLISFFSPNVDVSHGCVPHIREENFKAGKESKSEY